MKLQSQGPPSCKGPRSNFCPHCLKCVGSTVWEGLIYLFIYYACTARLILLAGSLSGHQVLPKDLGMPGFYPTLLLYRKSQNACYSH